MEHVDVGNLTATRRRNQLRPVRKKERDETKERDRTKAYVIHLLVYSPAVSAPGIRYKWQSLNHWGFFSCPSGDEAILFLAALHPSKVQACNGEQTLSKRTAIKWNILSYCDLVTYLGEKVDDDG